MVACWVGGLSLDTPALVVEPSLRERGKFDSNNKVCSTYTCTPYPVSVECQTLSHRTQVQQNGASLSSPLCVCSNSKNLQRALHMHIFTDLRYGLQAAINLRSRDMGLPWTLPSHMISLISSMASVVLASSKKTTVSRFLFRFSFAFSSALCRNFKISFSDVPP